MARRALTYGAFDYVTKPIDIVYLTRSIDAALMTKALDS
jgi:FixJ family two-component response regulator